MIDNDLLFVYGILKKGHCLSLDENEEATFVSDGYIRNAELYHIGGGVGLRLNVPGATAFGEIYQINDELWNWLDRIENNGITYTRKVVDVSTPNGSLKAWVYEHTYPEFEYTDPIEGGWYEVNEGY